MEVSFNAAAAIQELQAIPPRLSSALVKNFRTLGQKFERLIKGDLLTGNVLDRRTGQGVRSIFHRVEEERGAVSTPLSGGGTIETSGLHTTDVVLTVGANLAIAPYMRLLAYGGTIVPKNAQFLTLPMPAALTGNGVARFSARDVIGDPAAHGFSSTFTRMQGGEGMIYGVRYKRATIEGQRVLVEGGRVVPLFALKKSVTIPGRNYLHIAQTFLSPDIRGAMTNAVNEAAAG